MPYVIAFAIIIVAAGALLLFRQPVEEPVTANTSPAVESENNVPEGFTPPTTPPPSAAVEGEVSTPEIETELEPAVSTETYSALASYFTPRRTGHEMLITLELEGETVVDADVTYDGATAQSPNHTSFDNAYATEVIGKNINDVQLSRVGGASLSSDAFNEAVADIKAQL